MDWVIVAATVTIACSALASLWLTWRLSQDNRALRRAGTEPEVVAYLGLDQRSGRVPLMRSEAFGPTAALSPRRRGFGGQGAKR